MKANFLTFLAVGATLVSAQVFGDEPSCAIPCLTVAISKAGCALTDQGCQCGTAQTAIASAAEQCLISACQPAQLEAAESVGLALCSSYSASLTANTTPITKDGASPASTQTVVAITTPYIPLTSGVKVTPSTTPIATSGGSGTTTISTTSTSSRSDSSASSTKSANAANVLGAGVGGVMAMVAGVAAAL